MRLVSRFAFVVLTLCAGSAFATTEQIRRWILANKQSLPKEAQDAITNASNGEIATALLRMLGFKSTSHRTSISAASSIGANIVSETTRPHTSTSPPLIRNRVIEESHARHGVCPFDATPLLVGNEYTYCRPSHAEDCPSGYVCDQSFVLGRSICCKEGLGRGHLNKTLSTIRTGPVSGWRTVLPPRTTQEMIVVGQPIESSTKRTPWYIKVTDRSPNPWAARVTPAPPIVMTPPPLLPTTQLPPLVHATTVPNWPLGSILPRVTTGQPMPSNVWSRLWSTTAAPPNVVNVTVLQTGSRLTTKENQLEVRGAITLISDNGLHFLVDTGAASETEVLLRGLADASIALDDIDAVILTHAHPGHAGNLNFFGSKPILFHVNEHVGRHVATTELSERPYRKLTANVEVWKTPGHTPRDLSVLVHNVHSEEAFYGTMAIVGDLIPAEALLSERVDDTAEEGVWDAAIKRQNANLIICMADWVIPGHGAAFRVLHEYRQRAGCTAAAVAAARRRARL